MSLSHYSSGYARCHHMQVNFTKSAIGSPWRSDCFVNQPFVISIPYCHQLLCLSNRDLVGLVFKPSLRSLDSQTTPFPSSCSTALDYFDLLHAPANGLAADETSHCCSAAREGFDKACCFLASF